MLIFSLFYDRVFLEQNLVSTKISNTEKAENFHLIIHLIIVRVIRNFVNSMFREDLCLEEYRSRNLSSVGGSQRSTIALPNIFIV